MTTPPAQSRLGNLLRDLRMARGVSTRRLARGQAFSHESVRKYELGKAVPTERTVRQILLALEVTEQSEQGREALRLCRDGRTALTPDVQEALVSAAAAVVLQHDPRRNSPALELAVRMEIEAAFRKALGGDSGDRDP